MSKYLGIWILLWCLFRFVFHAISYDNTEIGTLVYFVANDLITIGIFLSIYSMIKDTGVRYFRVSNLQLKRLLKIVLTYSAWCLVVDVFLFCGIGAHDSALYTIVDMGILSIGTLWAIFV